MYFENSSILVFSFQLTSLNGLFVNKLKAHWQDQTLSLTLQPFFFPPTGPPLCPSLFFFFSFSLSLKKIVFFYSTTIIAIKKTYIHTKHTIIFFSHFKICYLKNGTKQIFCIMSTLNKCLYNTFQTTIFTLIWTTILKHNCQTSPKHFTLIRARNLNRS